MIRAGNLLRRAWHLLGRLGPFPVTARPLALSRDEYRLHSMTWGEPAHDAHDAVDGEIPVRLRAENRGRHAD